MTGLASIALGQLKTRLYNVRIIVVINLPLRFWERAIPKADRSPESKIVSLISNHVIPELRPLAVSGTPLGYLIGMTIENRRRWSVAAMTAQFVWRSRCLSEK
jgi:hypothetical protein